METYGRKGRRPNSLDLFKRLRRTVCDNQKNRRRKTQQTRQLALIAMLLKKLLHMTWF